jgi:hypothetical protein
MIIAERVRLTFTAPLRWRHANRVCCLPMFINSSAATRAKPQSGTRSAIRVVLLICLVPSPVRERVSQIGSVFGNFAIYASRP